MKLSKKNFMDMIFAKLQKHSIKKVNIYDIRDMALIIACSDEFLDLRNAMEEVIVNGGEVIKQSYIESYDDQGNIKFKMPKEEQEKVLEGTEEYKKLLDDFDIVIEKWEAAKQLRRVSEGLASFSFDDPDGKYPLQYERDNQDEKEARLYTDGQIESEAIDKTGTFYGIVRTLQVKNATFTIWAQFLNNRVAGIELRGISHGNFQMMIRETQNIMLGQDNNFNGSNQKPRVYIIKKH